jgi:hypothetical protein
MKRSITLFFCLLLSAALYCGTLAVTSTDPRGLMTQIGTTMSWYRGITNGRGLPADIVAFDVTYTKGDETNISVTIAYYYVSATAPAATTYLSYFPEADSTGTITTMTRYIAATGHYTFAIQIPDKCYYVVISFDHTSGTPTGTVVLAGYLNDWR